MIGDIFSKDDIHDGNAGSSASFGRPNHCFAASPINTMPMINCRTDAVVDGPPSS